MIRGLMMRIRVIPIWISHQVNRFFRFASSHVDTQRFGTKHAVLTVAAFCLLVALMLIIRAYRLSCAIRKTYGQYRYTNPDKQEISKLRRKSIGGSVLRILILAAIGFVLIYFVYPRLFGRNVSPSAAVYAGQESAMIAERLIMFGSRFGVLSFIVLWLWAFTRRFRSAGGRGFCTFLLLCCLIGFNLITAKELTIRQKEMGAQLASMKIPEDEMLQEAYRLYIQKKYARAEGIYAELAERGGYTKSSDADVLNNLALCQLQQEKNEEGLATMRRVFETENANTHHIINLLVAAHVNGITSRAILDETKARRMLTHLHVPEDDAGEFVKLRNALAYNLSYMDMELDASESDQGTGFGVWFPTTEIPRSMSAGWSSRDECLTCLEEALDVMQSDNQEAYGEEDPDIAELIVYLDALQERSN